MAQARKRRAAAIPAPLKNALSLHRAGRIGEAERAYRATLAAHPSHPQALHGIGTLYYQLGRMDAARDCLAEAVTRKAVTADPDEIADNPRARSARLRIARRTAAPAAPVDRRDLGLPNLAIAGGAG